MHFLCLDLNTACDSIGSATMLALDSKHTCALLSGMHLVPLVQHHASTSSRTCTSPHYCTHGCGTVQAYSDMTLHGLAWSSRDKYQCWKSEHRSVPAHAGVVQLAECATLCCAALSGCHAASCLCVAIRVCIALFCTRRHSMLTRQLAQLQACLKTAIGPPFKLRMQKSLILL